MQYEIRSGDEVAKVADGIIFAAAAAKDPLTAMAVAVLGGDRHTCCDEIIVALDGDVVVGAATIAPKGESGADMPEIVGVFVMQTHRRHGIGRELLLKAIERCRARGLVPVRATVLSRGMSALVKKLPPVVLANVQIVDMSQHSPF